MKITLAKALKLKNRIIRDLKKDKDLFSQENSRRSDSSSSVDVEALYKSILDQNNKLIEIKALIAIGNAASGITPMLEAQIEIRSLISYLKSVYVRTGIEIQYANDGTVIKEYTWNNLLKNEDIMSITASLEKQLDEFQDKIDKTNHTYEIETTF